MIEKYLDFEMKNISLFAKEILANYYDEELFNSMLKTYIDNRYYNYYESSSKDIIDTIFNHLNKETVKLLTGVDEETSKKISEMYMVFNYILWFDDVVNVSDKTLMRFVSDYRKELFGVSDLVSKDVITKLIHESDEEKKKIIDEYKSDDFYLEICTTSKDNIVDVFLNHKLTFPKLYSDYAINRVFTTGDISEDKLFVEYNLVSIDILNDLIGCIYDKYYMIEFAPTMFDNKEKLSKLMSITDNDCFKNKVMFKVNYESYAKYANNIKDMMRNGYMFSLFIEEKLKEEDLILLDIFNYIVVSSKFDHTGIDEDKLIILNDM